MTYFGSSAQELLVLDSQVPIAQARFRGSDFCVCVADTPGAFRGSFVVVVLRRCDLYTFLRITLRTYKHFAIGIFLQLGFSFLQYDDNECGKKNQQGS